VAELQQSREQEHKLYVLNLEHRTTLLMLQVMFASAPPKLTVKDYSWIARDHKTTLVCTRIEHFDAYVCVCDVVKAHRAYRIMYLYFQKLFIFTCTRRCQSSSRSWPLLMRSLRPVLACLHEDKGRQEEAARAS